MIHLEFDNDILSWSLESGDMIQKTIDDLFYAYYDSNTELIIAESGKNFIAKTKYAFQKNGVQLYKLVINCSLTWRFNNNDYFFEQLGLSQVLFVFRISKIFVLINNEIIILNMDSLVVYRIFSKNGDKFQYLEQVKDNLFVTIESNQTDNFGRNQFKYLINLETYQLDKIGLSY